MKEIKLTKNMIALVDDKNFNELNKHAWKAMYDGWNWYAYRNTYNKETKKVKIILMHREILKALPNQKVDHKKHYLDIIDNREENLRICTSLQNQHNYKKPKTNTSGYKGATLTKDGKYLSVITYLGKTKYLGRFKTLIEAAKRYDEEAKVLFGEFANLNFPLS